MRFKSFIIIFSSGSLIVFFFVLLMGYVTVKHINDDELDAFKVTHHDIEGTTVDKVAESRSLLEFEFHKFDSCRSFRAKTLEKRVARIDTFNVAGAIVKIDLSAFYANKSNSRLKDVNVTCLKAGKDCNLSVYMDQENSDGPACGCTDLRTLCYFEIVCKTHSLFGTKSEKRNYALLSEGEVRLLN